MRICEVEGCGKPHIALGLCKNHYAQLSRRTRVGTCSIEGCEKPIYARGYCETHYADLIETRSIPIIQPRQQSNKCAIEGCDRVPEARGYCDKHWTRWRKYGDPLALKKASWTESPKVCKYPNCDRIVHASGACRKHSYHYAKLEVIEHYGGKCSCCGESRIEFLCVDHMNNDGHKHKVNGRRLGGYNLYTKLIRDEFVSEFELQVLCHNCNAAKAGYGYCPHNSMN